ncbi:MAG: hypothetical protein AB1505_27100 [Candidatus Latescibacterota bacterium]
MQVVLVLAWIVLSVAVAILAERKGRSFELFLNVSLLLSPVVGLVAVGLTGRGGCRPAGPWRTRRCPVCQAPLAPGMRSCPACGAARPLARLQFDQEHTAWVWLGGITGGVLGVFALLGLLGLLLEALSRRSL